MKLVFMGTPDFAVASLEALVESGHEITLVVTQPDRPRGRGYTMTPSPVKSYALEKGLNVISPDTLKNEEVIKTLEDSDADFFIVTAYGRLLSKRILDIPKRGCVNVHASLLPKWRGAAPINRAVMSGDKKGGITLMYMDEGLDTGDMILTKEIDIPSDWTAEDYHDALMSVGKELLHEFLKLAEKGDIPRIAQDGEKATYAAKIGNEDAFLTFDETAEAVKNRIRGLSPFPGAFCFINGKRFKVRNAVASNGVGEIGRVLSTDKGGIEIACKDGSVIITRLCPEGKGVCDAESYLRGNKIENGTVVNER